MRRAEVDMWKRLLLDMLCLQVVFVVYSQIIHPAPMFLHYGMRVA